MAGPLQGLRVIEMAGIEPASLCGMLFADMGAEVVRVERIGIKQDPNDILARGRSTLQVDLRSPGGWRERRCHCRAAPMGRGRGSDRVSIRNGGA